MYQNGRTYFKNLEAFVSRFSNSVWPFWVYYPVKDTAQKMKFSIKDFFSKCDQIQNFW